MATGRIPLAYDLDGGWLWRLPGAAPWSAEYVAALARLVDGLGPDELRAKRAAVPAELPEFDYARQAARAVAFVRELIDPAAGA